MKKLEPKCYENANLEVVEEFMEYDFIIIQKATNNFSETNKIGGGGFGVVYKGTFEDGQQVVVKRLSNNLKGGNQEFKNEVALMVKFQHRNLVRLLGFSFEAKEVLLAWTHWKGGSASNVIDPMLRSISSPVDEITKCIHIALLCVQESVEDRPKMIEVLQMLNNLSISLPEPLDPGLFIRGSISSEASIQFTKNVKSISDQYHRKMQKKVISYEKSKFHEDFNLQPNGMSIFSKDHSGFYVKRWKNLAQVLKLAWKQWINGSPSNLIHPMLRSVSSPVDDIIKCIQVALLCIQEKAENRPTMSEVVQMLSNLSMSIPVPLAPLERVPPGLDDDCSTVCSEGSINEISVSEDDVFLRLPN
nr:uncharacterized protein LOC109167071 [Ipomoea trifida]